MEVADYFVDLKSKKYTLEKIDKPLLEIVDILGLDEDKDIDDIEEAEKVLNYALKYAQERKNKKNGIKTFTLNESVLLMTSFLSYFDFKYLSPTDISGVGNVFFNYDSKKIRKEIYKIKNDKENSRNKVKTQIENLIKKLQPYLEDGSYNKEQLNKMRQWFIDNTFSTNPLFKEEVK
mgnify:CR=1 FL=1